MVGSRTIASSGAPETTGEVLGTGSESSSARRGDIQGLRAIAVLLVVAFHAGLSVPGGFTGVDVFFVISGFVITAMLLREVASAGGVSFATFYARRVRRILPASALTISVVSVLSIGAINPSAQAKTARTGISGSFFMANVLLGRANTGYFDVAPTTNPLLHIWSLSVEEQFYLVFPALLIFGLFLARRVFPRATAARVLGAVVGTVAGVSFVACWYATTHAFAIGEIRVDSQLAFYLAPTRAWEFAAGALLAIGAPRLARLPRSWAMPSGLFGLAGVALGAFAISGTTPFPGTAALLPVVGTGLLLVAGTISSTGIASVLAVPPLARIGDLSYSWYLWHWPCIVFASALFPVEDHAAWFGAAISILPAWLSFRFFETPIRLDARIRGRRAVIVAIVCILVPALSAYFLLHAPKPPRSAATASFLAASTQPHGTEQRGCDRQPLDRLPERCRWSVPDPRGRIVLLGDSNASHFLEPAVAAANRLGFDLTAGAFPDCPFVDLRVTIPFDPTHTRLCHRFVAASLQQLVAAPPDLVILAASGSSYLKSGTTFQRPDGGPIASTPTAKAALWSEGLTRVLTRLAAAKIPVVVIHTVPQWETWDANSCAEVRVYLAPTSCGASQTRAEATAFAARSLAADNRALQNAPTTIGVDFTSDLCPHDRCATNRGNLWLYKDGRHLSVKGSQRLTGRFNKIIRRAIRLTDDGTSAPRPR